MLAQHHREHYDAERVIRLAKIDQCIGVQLCDALAILISISDLPLVVDYVEENEAGDLHFDNALRVQRDVRVLHHIQHVVLADALVVQVLLRDATDDVLLDPGGCLLIRNLLEPLLVLDLFETSLVQDDFDLDERVDTDHALLVDVVLFRKWHVQVDRLRDFGRHHGHVLRLESLFDLLTDAPAA